MSRFVMSALDFLLGSEMFALLACLLGFISLSATKPSTELNFLDFFFFNIYCGLILCSPTLKSHVTLCCACV